MKPPPFDYAVARSAPEAAELLAGRPGALVLAGGQSLLLELAYRRHHPPLLVDLNRAAGLDGVQPVDGGLRIGALVRHAVFERPPAAELADPVRRLLAGAAPYVAHPPIRARGTFCGSVAWGHPAAEWNAVLAGLAGTVQLTGPDGDREVAAADWFVGPLATARRAAEVVTAVTLPVLPGGTGVGFAEHRRTHATFAEVACAVAVSARSGTIETARVGLSGVGPVPVRAEGVEQALVGGPAQPAAATAAAARLPAADGDPHRRAVAAAMLTRALHQALAEVR